MRTIFLACMMLATLMICDAQLPSDLIVQQGAPQVLDLQHVVPASAKAIDQLNANLTAWKDKDMADLGHYFSYKRDEAQEPSIGVPGGLLNFSGVLPAEKELPANVGNATGNITVINGNSTGLIYL